VTGLAAKLIAVEERLSAASLPHAFGGAIALAYCTGDPRATVDLDVNVFVPVDRADEVFEALPSEIAIDRGAAGAVLKAGQVRLWWDETPIDLFFNYHPFHEHAAARVRMVPFDDASIPVLDCTDLVILKALFDRTKDWADIEAVLEIGAADPVVVKRWLTDLLGTDSPQFRRLVSVLNP
jgi:hypothetical protein